MSRLVFLPVPESFQKQYNKTGEAFQIDINIPIPAEIPDESSEKAISNIDMDMIISGMLRAIEEEEIRQDWKNYYSGFILFMRPDILEICQEEIQKKF
jgi:hypothetical protein